MHAVNQIKVRTGCNNRQLRARLTVIDRRIPSVLIKTAAIKRPKNPLQPVPGGIRAAKPAGSCPKAPVTIDAGNFQASSGSRSAPDCEPRLDKKLRYCGRL